MLKKITAVLLTAAFAASVLSVPAFAAESNIPPEVISESYVVMDADTGQVLIEKNMNKREFPASITKILTVAMALENAELSDKVTVTQEAAWSIEWNSSNIALQPGEVLTVEDLAYATMLPSANDAANVLAEHIGGTMEEFAKLMTAKAKDIGCTDTNFVNASGLPDDSHYTTAYDMALITKYAAEVPGFMPIFGMKDVYLIPPNAVQKSQRRFGTEHMMLVDSKYYYEGTLGGKLGWTGEAEHTIVTMAERGGRRLICVAMKSPLKYDKFTDSAALFNYCFDNFVPVEITKDKIKNFNISSYTEGGSAANISITGKESYSLLLHKSLTAGDIKISYDVPEYYSGEEINPGVSFKVSSGSMYEDMGVYPLEHSSLALDVPLGETDIVKEKATFKEQAVAIVGILAIILLVLAGLLLMLAIIAVCMRFINKHFRRKAKAKRRAAYVSANQAQRAGFRSPAEPKGLSCNSRPAEPKGYPINRQLAEPRGLPANRSKPYRPPTQAPPPRRRP